ncbi:MULTISPECIES: hypothetical protein [Pseudomonas]|uniref:Harpin HrpZ n=1 Tax=Pseudomonas quercus TaxID=2722792 RepID=A0ABX0YK78_9PSED|nr:MULTISPECIES: hypothetical protein [Pseudomonas]MBF7143249.1 hypothetical protein [Pseudomonas sp. LY10J]NJP03426.1 hypothetical protein [Pseudomonas quercus]
MQVSNTLPIQGARVQPSEGGGQQLSSLQKAIRELASQLMTMDGKLDESSPLGKMVASKMPNEGLFGSGQAQVEKALQSLIKEKLGENFGSDQAQPRTQGTSGTGGTGGSAGVGGANGGEEDLMTQLLKALVKSMLGGMLKPDGKGNSNFSEKDQAMLSKIGEFMDQNPAKFPPPDSGSWKTELSKGGGEQDNLLNADETGQVQNALDMLSSQLDAGSVGNAQGGLGGSGGSGGFGGGSSTPIGGVPQGGISAEKLEAALLKLLDQGAKGQTDGPSQQLTPRQQHNLDSTSAQTVQELLKTLVQSSDSQTSPSPIR